jgi:hypothetical protein
VQKIHAVIGGLRLAPHKEDYVRETVTALKDIGPDYIIPMHCTGEPFYEIAKAEMPGKLLRAYTGTRFVLGHNRIAGLAKSRRGRQRLLPVMAGPGTATVGC